MNRLVRPQTVFLGEISLSGNLRLPLQLETRLAAAQAIGATTCILPRVHGPETRDVYPDTHHLRSIVHKYQDVMQIQCVETVMEALACGLLRP
jgi:predicted ATP-dependent serine protease